MSDHSGQQRGQMAATMNRIYHSGLTTLSGGNLSIQDEDGAMWITPAGISITRQGVDKGALRPEDMVCIRPDGSPEGLHLPSSEYPFHRALYQRRPDLRAIVHAHPFALVSFSLVRQTPDPRILPQAHRICGAVGYAPYVLPGSVQLGETIAGAFAGGCNVVLLENHGVVTAGPDLLTAFQRFETLEFCARIQIKARSLGNVNVLDERQLQLATNGPDPLPEFAPTGPAPREAELREQIIQIVRRACARQIMISTQGVLSARLDDTRFLITPTGRDRLSLTPGDIVLIDGGKREQGKRPSRAARLHQAIYKQHPDIQSIISAQPTHAMAYAVSSARFDTRTIPESYILLVDVPRIPFEAAYGDPEKAAATVSMSHPVCLVENDCVLAAGNAMLQAFDRLEVAESSARALIETQAIGEAVPIVQDEIDKLTEIYISRLLSENKPA